MESMQKYPRTQHLKGSRLQPGDEDLEAVPFRDLQGRYLVIEEKMDGANCGLSFDAQGNLLLQSRGHYLTGGPRERHFDLFKTWAYTHHAGFSDRLGTRYLMYGEWMYAKHTLFYDALPHYFLEFDVFDRQRNCFLDTPSRAALLEGLPIVSVKVLFAGKISREKDLRALVGKSHFMTPQHCESLRQVAERNEIDLEQVYQQTDLTDQMEGLYIKVEEHGEVVERLKFVRADFLSRLVQSQSHWLDRPILPNQLAPDVDLFG